MEIKEIKSGWEVHDWNDFVRQNSQPASFLQSEEYSRLIFFDGQNIRLQVLENDETVALFSCFKKKIWGRYYFLKCPKGPIWQKGLSSVKKQEILKGVVNYLKKKNIKEKIVFLRVVAEAENKLLKKPKILTNIKEPEETVVLDLGHSEKELLAGMHSKTRYNIRLAERKGVTVREIGEGETEKALDEFYKLSEVTAKRDQINIFDKDYYKNIFDKLPSDELVVKLFLAEKDSEVLSAILCVGFGDTMTYFYGASSNELRNLMPNYLIQRGAIIWAKENGYQLYDFWGVSSTNPKWQGITRFKQGFVGESTKLELPVQKTYDLILNNFVYNVLSLIKRVKI